MSKPAPHVIPTITSETLYRSSQQAARQTNPKLEIMLHVRNASSLLLKRLVDTSVKAGLALGCLASLALAVGAAVGGSVGLIIAAIAAPALTIAVVNLIFEPFGRNAMAEDIREMLGRERRVIESGLQDVLDARTAKTATVVGTAGSVTVLPWHPTHWADREFRPLCELARTRKLVLRVFTPIDDESTRLALAHRLGIDPDKLAAELEKLPDSLCDAWDGVGVHGESTLEVWTYRGIPAIGLLDSDSVAAVDVGPAIRRGAFDGSSQVSIFAPDSLTAQSIREEIAAIEREATRGGVRPTHTPHPRGGQPHPLTAPEPSAAGASNP